MKNTSLFSKRIFGILFLGIIISGCGVWTDFTTYFNLYYNTTVEYEKAMAEIDLENRDIFEFKEKPAEVKSKQSLTKVVEKCSKILQFNSESSYFDDALFMIGKAFYYQQSYTRAIRKFLELLTLEDTGLHLEAQLWLGKSKLQLREFEEGLKILDEVKVLAVEEGEDEIYNEATASQVAYLIYKEEYPQAIEKCNEFVKTSENDEIISETYFKLGEIYNLLGEWNNAYHAFMQVNEYSPSYELEFFSLLEASKVLYKMDRNDASLELLDDMFNEDKFIDYADFIQLEMGLNYYQLDRINEARDVFILVDSTYSQSETVGIADFYLGKIWEYKLFDYDSAKQYYKLSSISPAPQEYKDSAMAKNEIFDKYFFLLKDYQNNNKKLYYMLNPEAYVQDSIAYAEYEIRLNDFYEQKRLEEEANDPASQDPQQLLSQPQNNEASNREAGNENNNLQDRENNTQTNVTQRRGTTGTGRQTNTGRSTRDQRDKILEEELPPELRKAVPEPLRSLVSADSLNALLAKNMFDMGNLFFTDFNVPDSSEYYYQNLLATQDSSRLYPNTLFALGSLYQSENDTVRADSLFRIIYNQYPKSTVYVEAAKKLGEWEEITEDDPSEELFVKAENFYYKSELDSAFVEWNSIVQDYPSSKFAPKALFTIGYILENELMLLDSAASVYSSLAELYGSSNYTARVLEKLKNYKLEKGIVDIDTTQIAIPDSINSVPDSINVGQNVKASASDSTSVMSDISPAVSDSAKSKTKKKLTESEEKAKLREREERMQRNSEIVEEIKRQKLLEKELLEKGNDSVKDSTGVITDSLKTKTKLKPELKDSLEESDTRKDLR